MVSELELIRIEQMGGIVDVIAYGLLIYIGEISAANIIAEEEGTEKIEVGVTEDELFYIFSVLRLLSSILLTIAAFGRYSNLIAEEPPGKANAKKRAQLLIAAGEFISDIAYATVLRGAVIALQDDETGEIE